MNKYRVLKSYPKQITNSGRLLTLKKGGFVYLKKEPQVLRLVNLGFIKQVVEFKSKPIQKTVKIEAPKEEYTESDSPEPKYNKKNKGK